MLQNDKDNLPYFGSTLKAVTKCKNGFFWREVNYEEFFVRCSNLLIY